MKRRTEAAAKRRAKKAARMANPGGTSRYGAKRGQYRPNAMTWAYRGAEDDEMIAKTKRDVIAIRGYAAAEA